MDADNTTEVVCPLNKGKSYLELDSKYAQRTRSDKMTDFKYFHIFNATPGTRSRRGHVQVTIKEYDAVARFVPTVNCSIHSRCQSPICVSELALHLSGQVAEAPATPGLP